MSIRTQINKEGNSIISLSASVFIHALIFLSLSILMNLNSGRSKINPVYVQIITQQFDGSVSSIESKLLNKNKEKIIKTVEQKKIISVPNDIKYTISTFSQLNADTTNLEQIYKESTLNVTIKYPAGWTFLDQDVKNKLDGVTFWAYAENYNPPPYIHLDVKDKDLFNPGRYKYKIKSKEFDLYYNDPEVLENQFTQIVYVRTESNEDFSLKLIMSGEESFKSFQPIFFGMIKTFKFGNSLF